MVFLIFGQNLDLNEVLVSLEKWEFLEKSLPCDSRSVLSTHQVPRNLHCLLQL